MDFSLVEKRFKKENEVSLSSGPFYYFVLMRMFENSPRGKFIMFLVNDLQNIFAAMFNRKPNSAKLQQKKKSLLYIKPP